MSLPWDTLVDMELPSDIKALMMLREMRKALPDVAPSERGADPACRRFKEAACLVVEERFDDAVAFMSGAGKVIPFPST